MIQSCTVNGCNRKTIAKGLCGGHYQRKKRFGSVRASIPLVHNHSGSKNPRWKGGMMKDGNRTLIWKPNHPAANRHGYVYRYRLVMEKKLGRYLLPSEIVHHKDEDESNDSSRNLEVTTQSKHIKIHLPKMHNANWLKHTNKNRNKKGQYA